MKLRDKLLVPIGLALLGVLAINLGALWAAGVTWSEVDAQRVAGHARVVAVQRAEVAFKQQVQEWKNILLRGHVQEDFLSYQAAFREREQEVRSRLDGIRLDMGTAPWARDRARVLLEEHRSLGRSYRQALDAYQTAPVEAARVADGRVRGIDRDLTARLEAFAGQVQQESDRAIAVATSQGRWTVMGLVVGAMVLSLLIVGLMLSVLHQLVVRPAQVASDLSRRLLDHHATETLELSGILDDVADDELGQVLEALVQVHRDLEAERAHLAAARNELEQARIAAAAATEAKHAFLARVTHELRTPLNGVVGSLALMRDEGLSRDQEEIMDAAVESSRRLASLVEDILEFTQVSGGDVDLHVQGFDIAAMMEGVLEGRRPFAESQGCSLSLAIAAGGPRRVSTDRERLVRVVSELVENAISATPGGRVEVVLTTADSGSQARVRIDVIDDGPGIPEMLRDTIFQPFTQVDEGYTRSKQGVGLGLSMCRRVVDHLGGALHHETVTGGGSRFWIELTVDKADASRSEASSMPSTDLLAPEPAPPDATVLLVGQALGEKAPMLVRAHHHVGTLEEALLALERQPYALALVEVGAVGLGSIVDLRDMTDSAGHLTALVAVARPTDRDVCLADGWDDVVAADAGPDVLQEVVARWVEGDGLLLAS